MSMVKINKLENLFLPAILFFAFILRFYNFPYRFSFGEDSIRDALVALEGAKEFQLPLTGSFSSLGPFTFGPWYYYHLILFSFTKLPYAPWIFMGLTSLIFVCLMYRIGFALEGKFFGLILAFLTAITASQISGATELTNPNLVPVYSALTILFFINIFEKNLSLRWSFLMGILIGIGINIHYQMLGFLIFPVLLLFKKKRSISEITLAFFGIFLTFIPLIIFDLNNHWYTLRNVLYYFNEGHKALYVPNRWLFYLRDFWPSFISYVLGLNKQSGMLASLGIAFAVIFSLLKRYGNKSLFFITVALILNFILLRFYSGPRGFAYLEYLYPLILIFFAYFFRIFYSNLLGKFLAIFLFLIVSILMLQTSVKLLVPDNFNLYMHKEASLLEKKDGKLSLYNCKNYYKFRTESVVYLLSLRNKISDNGTKIAFSDYRCPNLSLREIKKIDETGTFNITALSKEEINSMGWANISPKVIYNSTVRWWFNEQP